MAVCFAGDSPDEMMIRDSVDDWQALSALYEQADALDGGALLAWLATLDASGHRLLPQLRRMLAARDSAGREHFLDGLPAIAPLPERNASEWGDGSRLGPWRLIRHLGSGGMAEVWLAERADGAFTRQVAIKLLFDLPSRAQRESFAERFRRERDIVASLAHPNIAALHDAGVTPEGQPWLALEYVEGLPITQWCGSRQLTIERRVEVFRQVLLAVEHAHASLIIHRDLKPSNILVAADGTVKLLDFGIAKLVQGVAGAGDSKLTRQGGRPLTPLYASPEQLEGRLLTTASDVFSLGIVLHELLVGRRPDEVSVDDADWRRLPADLRAIIARMLGRTEERRYRFAEAVRTDIDRWQQGLPVTACPSTALYVASRFVSRHRIGSALASIALVALVATTVVAVLLGARARQESERAVAARDFVLDLFRVVDPDQNRNGDISARKMLETGRRNVATRLAAQPRLAADVLGRIGEMQIYIGDYVEAEATLLEAARIYREAGLTAAFLHIQADRADVAFQMGQYTRAGQLVAEIRQAAVDDEALLAKALHVQGWLSQHAGDLGSARAAMMQALQLATRAHGEADAKTIEILQGVAAVERSARNFAGARSHLQDAQTRIGRSLNAGQRDQVAIDMARLRVELSSGNYAAGSASAPAMIRRCDQQLGERTEDCLVLRNMHVPVLLATGERAAAEDLLPPLMASVGDTGSPRRRAESLAHAVRIATAGRDPTRKLELYELAATSALDASLDARLRADLCLALAEARLFARDGDTAELWARQALTLATPDAPAAPTRIGRSRLLWALALQLRSRDDEALQMLESARGSYEAVWSVNHPLVALLQLNEAASLSNLGKRVEAESLIDSVMPRLVSGFGETAPVVPRAKALKDEVRKGTLINRSSGGFFDIFS